MSEILETINAELIRLLSTLATEKRRPGPDVDNSDETISDCEKRIAVLRRIRIEIEDSYI